MWNAEIHQGACLVQRVDRLYRGEISNREDRFLHCLLPINQNF